MRLSEHAKTPIKGVEAWVAVAVLGSIGVIYEIVQHLPHGASWLWGGTLVLFWSGTFVQLYRHGLRALTLPYLILIVGYTLFAGSHLWQRPPAAIAWAEKIGIFILLMNALATYVEFGKKRDAPPLN